tara:strand:- start:1072 stop:2139 length:1068 start_codon:yes stop_codon:yes gene_type:complete
MDLLSSNLQATNAKYNSVLSKLESLESDAISNLETAASTATSTMSSQLNGITSELRTLVPEGFSVPNVSLQGQLQSLSGLTDATQSANLLASIKLDFGSALTSGGFNLDTLVSDAAAAVGAGTSLSGVIPNFELSPIGDIIQKASETKLPDIDAVTEKAASFVSNEKFTAAKTTATNAVFTTSETFPTADAGYIKVSEKFKKITQSFGGVSISKPVTTPALAFENNVRKTVSSKGFSHRVTTTTEKFTVSDMEEIGGDKVVTLKHEPTKIEKVYGRIQKVGTESSIFRLVNLFNLSELARSAINEKYEKDVYSIYPLNNKQVVIKEVIRQYDGTPWAIRIQYKHNETYDPNYAKA